MQKRRGLLAEYAKIYSYIVENKQNEGSGLVETAQNARRIYNLGKRLASFEKILYNHTRRKQNRILIKEGNHHGQEKHQKGRSRVFGRT